MPAARIRVFATRELLAEQLAQEIQEGDWILVKGSRAMEMERTVSFLQQQGAGNHTTMQ
jgi:UDP-N-acetylmuramyl pentapeptide synthase